LMTILIYCYYYSHITTRDGDTLEVEVNMSHHTMHFFINGTVIPCFLSNIPNGYFTACYLFICLFICLSFIIYWQFLFQFYGNLVDKMDIEFLCIRRLLQPSLMILGDTDVARRAGTCPRPLKNVCPRRWETLEVEDL
jgi:hypothetical protein